MKIAVSDRAAKAISDAPSAVRKPTYKQLRFLATNIGHPSLRAKKYDESSDVWQARVNRDWRMYFRIEATPAQSWTSSLTPNELLSKEALPPLGSAFRAELRGQRHGIPALAKESGSLWRH